MDVLRPRKWYVWSDLAAWTASSPEKIKIYMGVAADCTYVSTYNGQENATSQILNNWNSASALYKVCSEDVAFLGLSLKMWDRALLMSVLVSPNSRFEARCKIFYLWRSALFTNSNSSCPSPVDTTTPWNIPCSSAELDSRLSLFSQWRGTKGNDSIGLWHLMSGCPTGSEVGIAWLATLYVSKASLLLIAYPCHRCQQDATGSSPSIVSGTGVSTAGRTEWQVVAHEIGHNFGAIVSNAGVTFRTLDLNDPFFFSL